MFSKNKILIAFLGLLFFARPAQALIELRAGYSYLSVNPGDLNAVANPYPSLGHLGAWSADLIFNLPTLPVGVGARYEAFAAKDANATGERKVDWTRVSLLVNSRLIDGDFFLGPIATLGVSNRFRFTLTPAGTTTSVEYKATGNISGAVGVEGGYHFSLCDLGAELGLMYAPLGDLQDSAGQNVALLEGGAAKTDMNGIYMRITLGFNF